MNKSVKWVRVDGSGGTIDGAEKPLVFDLHPLYGSILTNGSTVREGEVIGLDADLRRALIAPFSGTIRLLTTNDGDTRRLRVYLTPNEAASSHRR